MVRNSTQTGLINMQRNPDMVWDSAVCQPSALAEQDKVVGAQLAQIARTGVVPWLLTGTGNEWHQRSLLARRLFVTRADLAPLLVLLAAVTGRNSETLKELPAEHRVLDGVAVELRAVKRRRGAGHWTDTLVWEIGPAHRQLHTPGGLYLLLHRLMARGRALCCATSLWAEWRNGVSGAAATVAEHRDPFAANLSTGIQISDWAAGHALRADPIRADAPPTPLRVKLGRIRTTVEVRRTRALGGHLPSAARSNSISVLFASYLRGDPTAQEWAEDVVGQAVLDAEQAALAVHRTALAETGRASLRVRHDPAATEAVDGVWTACSDPETHPGTGKPCRQVSFLDCFHCGNSAAGAASPSGSPPARATGTRSATPARDRILSTSSAAPAAVGRRRRWSTTPRRPCARAATSRRWPRARSAAGASPVTSPPRTRRAAGRARVRCGNRRPVCGAAPCDWCRPAPLTAVGCAAVAASAATPARCAGR
ncbi:hypothetical protein [Kutzneria sp. 744]|uniref:hypothetical protein n=1 Tax=Kutzneria sp. (strain 744) TaxID=345341 RepID=UPI0003EEC5E1|nr:hypothetical protein [Kutzneria sp. 744]EWM19783.1 LigA protein [Kutzneria sp. 744]